MIWYLLYPFRGSTEPPILAQDHPIRKAFVLHGTRTAKYWLLSILISTSIALLLCYPAFFLYGSSTSSLHSIPYHAWTSAKRYHGSADARADVEMRQIWVLGDYMKALDPHLIHDAMTIQDQMFGPGFGHELSRPAADEAASQQMSVTTDPSSVLHNPCKVPSGQNLPWGFHSPLMYWNCTVNKLNSSEQILDTIHEELHRRSFLNITLRPSTVLAGKFFSRGRLMAADALVITLFDRVGFGIGDQWEARAKELIKSSGDGWAFYPKDGISKKSLLYEFVFEPMSSTDDIILIICYVGLAFFVVSSLGKMRAVKSQVGLLFTICVEAGVALLASFTTCGLLGINLKRIPREWYPFVVLVLGVENRFRLVKAVLAYPPEMQVVDRLANALGDVGHLSLGHATQNLLGLWLLSRIVSVDVANLCGFAAIAILIDWIFHLTFFTAVLSVDIKRMELQESLSRAKHIRNISRLTPQIRISFVDAILTGRLPISTRVAGTVVAICFVLTLNMHFKSKSKLQLLLELLRLRKPSPEAVATDDVLQPPPINVVRTPSAWLEMQDHETARDILQWVKPKAVSIIARVHEPLTLVRSGSNRAPGKDFSPSVLNATRDLASKHAFPFVLVVAFIIAMIYLLMNYLTYDEHSTSLDDASDNDQLSVETLAKGHHLDIVKLVAADTYDYGHLLSFSIDKVAAIWLCEPQGGTFTRVLLRTSALKPPLWPISAAAVDESNSLAALCADDGRIAFWSIQERRFVKFVHITLARQTPVLLSLNTLLVQGSEVLTLTLVTAKSVLYSIDFATAKCLVFPLAQGSIVSAKVLNPKGAEPIILCLLKTGKACAVRLKDGQWSSWPLFAKSNDSASGCPQLCRSIEVLPCIEITAVFRGDEVSILDNASLGTLFSLPLSTTKTTSMRIVTSSRRHCLVCHGAAVRNLSIAYVDSSTSSLIIDTYTTGASEGPLICLQPSRSEPRSCPTLDTDSRSTFTIDQPGAWETTNTSILIGIRKTPSPLVPPSSSGSGSEANGYFSSALTTQLNGSLKRRGSKTAKHDISSNGSLKSTHRPVQSPTSPCVASEWQVWCYRSCTGEFTTRSLPDSAPEFEDDDELFVASPGPMARVGKRGVAVAMGNVLKIVSARGSERADAGSTEFEDAFTSLRGSLRKKAARKTA